MTAAMGLLVRRSLTTNRRAVLGLALVIALAGGVALTSLAGARRTASAFPRYLDAAEASDVAINPVPDDFEGEDAEGTSIHDGMALADAARSLPEVEGDATYVGIEYAFVADEGREPFGIQPELVGSVDGRFLTQDRLAVLDGRLPDAGRADEAAVNRQAAALLGLEVGSTIRILVPDYTPGEDDDVDPRELPLLAQPEVRVTGIGLFPEEVLSDDFDGSPRVLLTPALTGQLIDQAGTYIWQGLRLTPGTSVDDGIRAYTSGLPDGYQVNVQRTDTQVDRVGRSVRPLVVALAVFGSAAALAAVALGGLGALRLMGAAATDTQALQAVGLSRRARRTIVAAPALTAAVAGALGAIGLSIALSPLMPIGAVREVEPDPGLDVDTTAVLLGGLVIGLLVAAVAFAAAQRVTRPGTSASPRVLRPSWLVQRIAGLGLGPIAVVGAGHAVGGERRSGVPTRSTLVACAISVVALATAITFGASVRAFLDTPASYGWAADLAIHSGGGYDYLDPEGAGLVLDEPGIEALSVGGFGLVRLGDREVNTLGLVAAGGELLVTVVEGSAPVEGDEIALGASTARELKVGVGDQVEGPAGRLRVVGIVALPALGPIASAHPSLGQGALVALEALPELDQNGYPSMALVRLADGLDVDQEGDRITVAVTEAMSESTPDFAAHYTDLRPSEVVALGPATRTAYLLAALLGAAAVLALGLTLSASVRRRHQTYAVLSALGFDRGDLRQTVRWESNLVVFSALVLGLPIGVALGRVAWTAFSDQLGGAGGPRVPLVLLTGAVAALVVVANLVGELPARTAGRRRIPRALSQQR